MLGSLPTSTIVSVSVRRTFNCLRQFSLAAEAASQRQHGCLRSSKSHVENCLVSSLWCTRLIFCLTSLLKWDWKLPWSTTTLLSSFCLIDFGNFCTELSSAEKKRRIRWGYQKVCGWADQGYPEQRNRWNAVNLLSSFCLIDEKSCALVTCPCKDIEPIAISVPPFLLRPKKFAGEQIRDILNKEIDGMQSKLDDVVSGTIEESSSQTERALEPTTSQTITVTSIGKSPKFSYQSCAARLIFAQPLHFPVFKRKDNGY